MAVLADINVLLPLIYGAHVHHARAMTWLNAVEQRGGIIVCRTSQLGLLRLLNNPAVMSEDAKTGAEAWGVWDALMADDRFRYSAEPDGFEKQFRGLTRGLARQPKSWQDAYLAAFAIAGGMELVTFDAGFRSFKGLRLSLLRMAAAN